MSDPKLMGGLSFTVTRERAPLYTMGSAAPRSFSRGKRGIAGSMISLVFDRSALNQAIRTMGGWNRETWEDADVFMEWDGEAEWNDEA